MKNDVIFRTAQDVNEIIDTIGLQTRVWGSSAAASLLEMVAAIHNGGMIITAHLEKKIVGFCYGFTGYDGSQTYLCSHMMAIDPGYRDLGLGRELKFQQRKWALNFGYRKIVWTYDPLEARNAYLNLCKLGGYTKTYFQSYYGQMEDQLNKGMPSDRFLVEWDLDSGRAQKAAQGLALESKAWSSYPYASRWVMDGFLPKPSVCTDSQGAAGYLVPVPKSIQEIKTKNMELAKEWRMILRCQIENLLQGGYVVSGFLRTDSPVNYYVLEKNFH